MSLNLSTNLAVISKIGALKKATDVLALKAKLSSLQCNG